MRFLLIHGGFHGAWCWNRMIPELERLGHRAIGITTELAIARASTNTKAIGALRPP
jgi:hypothetical protein